MSVALGQGAQELERLGDEAVRPGRSSRPGRAAGRTLGGDADRPAGSRQATLRGAGCGARAERARQGWWWRAAASRDDGRDRAIDRPTIVPRLMNSRRLSRPRAKDSTTSSCSGVVNGEPCPARNSPSVLILQRARLGGDAHMPCIVRNMTPRPAPVASSRPAECLGTVLAALPTVNEHPALRRLRDTPDVRITGIPHWIVWSCPSSRRSRPPGTPCRAARSRRRSSASRPTRASSASVGDTMDGFEAFEHLFIGGDPLAIAHHVRVLETIDFHAGRYWPIEVALWDIIGQVAGLRSRPSSAAPPTASRPMPRAGCCCPGRPGRIRPAAARRRASARSRSGWIPGGSGGPRRRGGDPARGRRLDGDHGRHQPGLADGRRHDALDRPGGGPGDRAPARRVRRPVAGGAARRHGPGGLAALRASGPGVASPVGR